MSIKMSPSERADSISPQGSAKACENINGGIFKFEEENMEKIQYEVWPKWPKRPKTWINFKKEKVNIKNISFYLFWFFLN